MTSLPSDMTPGMEKLYFSLLRQASPAQKMEMLSKLNATARKLAIAGIRKRHPQASPQQVNRMLASLLLGEELARKVFGYVIPD